MEAIDSEVIVILNQYDLDPYKKTKLAYRYTTGRILCEHEDSYLEGKEGNLEKILPPPQKEPTP